MMVCLPGAIYREEVGNTVLINGEKCINCATCAMACPFGVIRYHEDSLGPPGKAIAVKCDNCIDRRARGQVPACVEVCKCGALTFEEPSSSFKRKTDEMARRVSAGAEERAEVASPGFVLMNVLKRAQVELSGREA